MNNGLFTVSTAIALALSAQAWSPAYAQQQQGQQQLQAQPQQQTQGQGAQVEIVRPEQEAEVEVIRPAQEQQQVGQQETQPQAGQQQGGDEVDIVTWNQARDELRQGWTAEWMFDRPVYGAQGEDIGEVDNVFIGTDGRIEAIVVEAGGFWDIGDTHLRIPWQEVQLTEDRQIVVDVREEQVPDFDLFNFDDEQGPGPRAFRATELIGDYVRLEDEAAYGYVSDIVFNRDGEVAAVVVSPSYAYGARYGYPYGYYAYPYYGYGYGFAPGEGYYDLPYTSEEVAEAQPFDYRAMGVGEDEGPMATGGGQRPMMQQPQGVRGQAQ